MVLGKTRCAAALAAVLAATVVSIDAQNGAPPR